MHLVSPALPVGAYAYSQGLEYAVDSGWLNDESALENWLRGVMEYGFGGTGVIALSARPR